MPRTIPPALQSHLEGDGLTLATCVRLARRDGTVLGFTTSAEPLTIQGLTYEAVGGIDSTAMKQSVGGGVDNLDITGLLRTTNLLSSPRITESDLRAGRYDAADVLVFLVNFLDVSAGKIVLLRGNLGEIRLRDGAYSAEVRSLTQRCSQQIGDVTSATCRVKRLGDGQCGVNLAGFTVAGSVSAVVAAPAPGSPSALQFAGVGADDGFFTYGLVKFTSGSNAGIEREIKSHTLLSGSVAQIVLQEAFPLPVVAGDAALLTAGCDRTFGICGSKFANTLRFRGEPHLPGSSQYVKMGRAQ